MFWYSKTYILLGTHLTCTKYSKYKLKKKKTQKYGKGLCPVQVLTGHVKIWTCVQEWTPICNPTCPIITFTGHKPHPRNIAIVHKNNNNNNGLFYIGSQSNKKKDAYW